ncbi:MAG: glycosyltransferase family 2 protein [Pseudomonadota bacterium]
MARKFLFSCMRNEAPYVLEWVAYHRLIGFEEIVVCTNDCTDNTAEILDALSGIGWVTHIRNPVPNGVSAQLHAASRIGEEPPWHDDDWVMWLDTDEFLNIHAGNGRLDDLIGKFGDRANGYAVHWRIFGSSGLKHWESAPVIERFTKTAPPVHQLHEPVKTLFRWSRSIEGLHTHRPMLRPSFRERSQRWLHGPGEEVPESFYYTRLYQDASPALRLPAGQDAHAWAQINHYALKSLGEFRAKAWRGPGLYKDRHNEEYWSLYDLNDVTEHSISRHLSDLSMSFAQTMAHADLHKLVTLAMERVHR